MIKKLDLLLKFNPVFNNRNLKIAVTDSNISLEIIKFVQNTISFETLESILELRCKRALYRALGFVNILDLLKRAKYPSMKHEVLCYVGTALRGIDRTIPSHFLDCLSGCVKELSNLVQTTFYNLMQHIGLYLGSESGSDAALQLLALDTFALRFQIEDHEFLYNIRIFEKLYELMYKKESIIQYHDKLKEYENNHRKSIPGLARNLYYFLGAICIDIEIPESKLKEEDAAKNITKLQSSFFNLVITRLSNYISQQKCPRCNDICNCDIVDAIALPAMSKSKEIEIEYVMGLLCVISTTPIGKQCLSTCEFIQILLNLIFCSRKQLKLYTMKSLYNLLPYQSPNTKFGKNTLLSILLDLIGGILSRYLPEQNENGNDLNRFLISNISIIERNGISSLLNNEDDESSSSDNTNNSLLDLSHPFFDVDTNGSNLPTGWDRTSIINLNQKQFIFSSDNRTVSYIGISDEFNDSSSDKQNENNNIEIPAFIKADKGVSNLLRFFYFEVRIEDAGNPDSSLFFGLLRKNNNTNINNNNNNNNIKENFDFYAIDKSGKKIRPPQELPYSTPLKCDDVIGCGWYSRTGEIFFTKNGKALGVAFKNVFGEFYPFVGVNSQNSCILANFGQMPFRFDVEPSITLTFSTKPSSIKTHECLSLVDELSSIIRSLISHSIWNDPIQKEFIKSIENCQLWLETKKKKKKKKEKKLLPLLPHMLSCFTILGCPTIISRVGSKVRIHPDFKEYGGINGIILDIINNNAIIGFIQCNNSKPPKKIQIPIHMLNVIPIEIPGPEKFSNQLIETFFIFIKSLIQLTTENNNNIKSSINFPMFGHIIVICLRILHHWIKYTTDLRWMSFLDIILQNLRDLSIKPIPFYHSELNILENLLQIINCQLFELLAYGGVLHDTFEPASWALIEEQKETIKMGSWYLVAKRGTGPEWINQMDDTVSYIGYVTVIDQSLSLAKLKFYDYKVGSTTEWWYSFNDLAQCPPLDTKWPFISASATLEDAYKSLNILLHSISIANCRKILIYFIGYFVGINSYKLENKELIPLSIDHFIPQLKLHVQQAPACSNSIMDSLAKAHEDQNTMELKILQAKVYQLLKRESVESNPLEGGSKKNKSGFLLKRSKRFRTWTKLWFIAHDNYVYYQRFQTSSSPLGAICLNDVINAEQKGARIFKVSTQTREYTLQTYSQRTTQAWVSIFQKKLWKPDSLPSKPFPQQNNSKSSLMISKILCPTLTDAIIKNFKQNSNTILPHIIVESEHPYRRSYSKKIIQIPGAEAILIIFDKKCNIKPNDVLEFYTAGFGKEKELLKSYCGNGKLIFVPFSANTNRIWMELKIDNNRNIISEWGYKFYVYPIRMKVSDTDVLVKGSFNFACCISEWLLRMSPVWVSGFYKLELYDILVSYLNPSTPIHQKIRITNLLIPIIQRINLFQQSPDLSKLNDIKNEFFLLIEYEQNNNISNGNYSEYIQRLFELMVNCYIISGGKTFESALIFHNSQTDKNDFESIEDISFSELTESGGSEYIDNIQSQKLKLSYPQWFKNMINTVSVLKQLLEGDSFPIEFIKEACYQSRKEEIVQESPHPYPSGARVTAAVRIPNATSLLVIFDEKSVTEQGVDHLLFSRETVGADDIGAFSGYFGGKRFEIQGNSFVWSFLSDSSSSDINRWGFKFTVIPTFDDETNQKLFILSEEDYDLSLESKGNWTLAMDYELVSIIEQNGEKLSKSCINLNWNDCDIEKFDVFNLPYDTIRQRFNLLKYLNTLTSKMLPFIDMRYVNDDWSIAFMIGAIRRLLFIDEKMNFFEDILSLTRSYRTSPIITLNRHFNNSNNNNNNNNQHNNNIIDDNIEHSSDCLFIQGFKQLNHLDPELLRQPDRAWAVKFYREGAMDIGGPYREALTEFCNDIRSIELGLFLRCPNATSEIGFNQDKYIPNPSAISEQQLKQFEFIGKLIGISIRTKNTLDLSFPSIIWKPLVFTKLEWSDLEAIDQNCCKFIEAIRDIHLSGVTSETFYDLIFETFTTTSSDGNIVELKQDGKNCKVTWENRIEFTTLVEQYRLNEFKLQTDAIAKGIQCIIPSYYLGLFSWQQLESRVCGDPNFDIDLLKRKTIYVSVLPQDQHILMFWEVLDEFSAKEKALFIRFVWGRSQLPRESEFTQPFQLQAFPSQAQNQDDLLPSAQTCFFSLSLPKYSSKDIMNTRLLYAITTCREIDSDFVVPDGEFTMEHGEE